MICGDVGDFQCSNGGDGEVSARWEQMGLDEGCRGVWKMGSVRLENRRVVNRMSIGGRDVAQAGRRWARSDHKAMLRIIRGDKAITSGYVADPFDVPSASWDWDTKENMAIGCEEIQGVSGPYRVAVYEDRLTLSDGLWKPEINAQREIPELDPLHGR